MPPIAFRVWLIILTSLSLCSVAFPAGWFSADVGSPTPSGSTSINGTTGNFVLSGGGQQSANNSDKLHLAHQVVSGNFELTAKMVGLVANGIAGLEVRESLDAGARYVAITIDDAASEMRFHYRDTAASARTETLVTSASGGEWLRLKSVAGTVSVYYSTDGNVWTSAGSLALDLGYELLAGLRVTGFGTSTAGTAEFSNVTMASNLPAPEPTLALWLRADTEAATGTTFVWSDQSGNARHASQATSASQPTIVADALAGKPVIDFDGSNDYLSVGSSTGLNPAKVSVFAVARRDAGTADAILSKYTATTGGYMLGHSSGTVIRYWIGNEPATATATYNTFDVLGGIFDQQNVRVFKNGTEGTANPRTAAPVTTTGSILIGSMTTAGSRFNGQIAEVLLFTDAVSEAQRREVDAYFYSKYGRGTKPDALPPVILAKTVSSAYEVPIDVPRGHRVYYTTDGTDPTTSGTRAVYDIENPFSVATTATVRAYAEKMDHNPSAVVEAVITVDSTTHYVSHEDLKLWLRADAGIVTNGSGVTTWLDQSGWGNHAAAPTNNEPVYLTGEFGPKNKPALQFVQTTGNIDYLAVADSDSLDNDQVTVFAVAQRASNSNSTVGGMVVKHNASTAGYYLQTLAASPFYPRFAVGGNGVSANASTAPGWSDYAVINGVFDQTNVSLFGNGALAGELARTAAALPTANSLFIGSQSATAGRFIGKIAEVLVYGSGLSSVKRREVEAYLHTKYGVGSAPASDPPGIASQTLAGAGDIEIGIPDGHTVHYSLNGGTLTAYTGPIHVTQTSSLHVTATKDGHAATEVTVAITVDAASDYVARSGLGLWLRSDLGVNVVGGGDTAVTQWLDQSGKGNHASQETAANRPFLTTATDMPTQTQPPVVQFATSDHLVVPDKPGDETLRASEASVFAVVKRSSGTGAVTVVEKYTTSPVAGYSLRMQTAAERRFYVNGTYSNSSVATGDNTKFAFLGGIYEDPLPLNESNRRKLYVNGTETKNDEYAGPMAGSSNPLYVGGRGTTNLPGQIAEVLVYNRSLQDWERRELDAYIFQKYGVGVKPQVIAPMIDKGSQIYAEAQLVSIAAPDMGAAIYYTLNGDEPSDSTGTLYTGPFMIGSTATVKAKAYKDRFNSSDVAVRSIIIDPFSGYIANSNLLLWLRSDAGLKVSTGVEMWEDKSGLGNDVSGSGSTMPSLSSQTLAGHPLLRFTKAENDYLEKDSPAMSFPAGHASVFVVFKPTTSTSDAVLVERHAASKGFSLQNGANTSSGGMLVRQWITGTETLSGSTSLGPYWPEFELVGGISGQANRTLYRNGVKIGEDSPSSMEPPTAPISPTAPIYIGGRAASMGFDGEIAEVLVYDSALSEGRRREVEAYVFQRYGVGTKPTAVAPVITIGSGPYALARTVSMTAADAGAAIHYTLDGSVPSSGSPVYAEPFLIHATTTIRAIALKPQFHPSALAEQGIAIDIPWLRTELGTNVDPVAFAPASVWQFTSQATGFAATADSVTFISTDGAQGASLEWLSENPDPSNGTPVGLIGIMARRDQSEDSAFVFVGFKEGYSNCRLIARIAGGVARVVEREIAGVVAGDRLKLEVVGNTVLVFTRSGESAWVSRGGVDLADPTGPELGRGLMDGSGTTAALPFRIGMAAASGTGGALRNFALSAENILLAVHQQAVRWHRIVEPRTGSTTGRLGMQNFSQEPPLLVSNSNRDVGTVTGAGFAASDYLVFPYHFQTTEDLPSVRFTHIIPGTSKPVDVYMRWASPPTLSEDGANVSLSYKGDYRPGHTGDFLQMNDEGDVWVYLGRIGAFSPNNENSTDRIDLRYTLHPSTAFEMTWDGFLLVAAETDDDLNSNGIKDSAESEMPFLTADGDFDGNGWSNYQQTLIWSKPVGGAATYRLPSIEFVDYPPASSATVFGAYGHWLAAPLRIRATYQNSSDPIKGLGVSFYNFTNSSGPQDLTSPIRIVRRKGEPEISHAIYPKTIENLSGNLAAPEIRLTTKADGTAEVDGYLLAAGPKVDDDGTVRVYSISQGLEKSFIVRAYDNTPPGPLDVSPQSSGLAKTQEQPLNEVHPAADSIVVRGALMAVGCSGGAAHGQSTASGYVQIYHWSRQLGKWESGDVLIAPVGATNFGSKIKFDESVSPGRLVVEASNGYYLFSLKETGTFNIVPDKTVIVMPGDSFDISGTWLAIGEQDEDEVRVYQENPADSWTLVQTLQPQTTDPADHFGVSVSFTSSGTNLVVGAPGDPVWHHDPNGDPPAAPSVYLYEVNQMDEWELHAQFSAEDSQDYVHAFGAMVKALGDNVIAVGAPYAVDSFDASQAPEMGYVQLFAKDSMDQWAVVEPTVGSGPSITGGGPSFGAHLETDGSKLYLLSEAFVPAAGYHYYATPQSISLYDVNSSGEAALVKEIFPLAKIDLLAGDGDGVFSCSNGTLTQYEVIASVAYDAPEDTVVLTLQPQDADVGRNWGSPTGMVEQLSPVQLLHNPLTTPWKIATNETDLAVGNASLLSALTGHVSWAHLAFSDRAGDVYEETIGIRVANDPVDVPQALAAEVAGRDLIQLTWQEPAVKPSAFTLEQADLAAYAQSDPGLRYTLFEEVGRFVGESSAYFDRRSLNVSGYAYRLKAHSDEGISGYSDAFELVLDQNENGTPDWWEASYGVTLDGSLDYDGDGWTNAEEYVRGTDPTLADTDGDGLADDVDPDPLDRNINGLKVIINTELQHW